MQATNANPALFSSHLFGLLSGSLSGGLGTLLTDTNKASVRASDTESAESVLGGGVGGDGALGEADVLDDGEGSGNVLDVLAGLDGLDLLSGGVTLLGRLGASAAGEDNEALPVLLETLDVGLQRLLGEVLAAGVDRDTDGGRKLAGDTSGLETG